MTLNPKALSLTFAIMGGLGLFVITWWLIIFEGSSGDPTILGRIYRGYNISAMGSIIGLAWGFIDGMIGGLVVAWLYNKFAAQGG